MIFANKYPEAKENILYEYGNYMWSPKADNCYMCGRLTHFIEVNVQAHICSEECDEKFYDEMFAAAAYESSIELEETDLIF
jgi:hypothetical protein